MCFGMFSPWFFFFLITYIFSPQVCGQGVRTVCNYVDILSLLESFKSLNKAQEYTLPIKDGDFPTLRAKKSKQL